MGNADGPTFVAHGGELFLRVVPLCCRGLRRRNEIGRSPRPFSPCRRDGIQAVGYQVENQPTPKIQPDIGSNLTSASTERTECAQSRFCPESPIPPGSTRCPNRRCRTAPSWCARRTLHLRFNDLDDPASIPRDTDYASVFESDVPIILQHTRLDFRHAEVSLLSTMAYPEG